MKTPAEFPYEVRTAKDAEVIGAAIHKAVHFDPGWAGRVFRGDPSFNRNTGPDVLRQELHGMWRMWDESERRIFMTAYTTERLK